MKCEKLKMHEMTIKMDVVFITFILISFCSFPAAFLMYSNANVQILVQIHVLAF